MGEGGGVQDREAQEEGFEREVGILFERVAPREREGVSFPKG